MSLNPAFHNGTATIYHETSVFDGIEESCDKVVLHSDIPVQICCSDGKTGIQSCGIKYENKKDIQIRIHPDYTFPIDVRRYKYTIELQDCLGEMGKFQVEDVGCVKLPSSGLYCYKLSVYKIGDGLQVG